MGKKRRGKQDGTGPFEGSYMFELGRRGRKAGRKRGEC